MDQSALAKAYQLPIRSLKLGAATFSDSQLLVLTESEELRKLNMQTSPYFWTKKYLSLLKISMEISSATFSELPAITSEVAEESFKKLNMVFP